MLSGDFYVPLVRYSSVDFLEFMGSFKKGVGVVYVVFRQQFMYGSCW